MPGIYNDAQLSSFIDQIFKRLERLEEHAALVAKTVGVPFATPTEGVPEDVVELARSGDRMGAIKRYRELTGAGMDEASEVVSGI